MIQTNYTKIELTHEEVADAIVKYLASKGVRAKSQYVDIDYDTSFCGKQGATITIPKKNKQNKKEKLN